MTDVSLLGAFLAGLVSFLSPCVLPLVPGYISMLSGIGMEQLRQGQPPRAGLFASSLAFVFGFSVVFISFGASASAVGTFLRQNRTLLAPIAGALILLFGLHLLGILIKLTVRTGLILGALLAILGIIALFRGGPLFAGFGAVHSQRARGGKAWRTYEGRRLMDAKSKEHALEYAVILGVGALMLVLVFVNLHSHIFA